MSAYHAANPIDEPAGSKGEIPVSLLFAYIFPLLCKSALYLGAFVSLVVLVFSFSIRLD
jgi:hypothetical protein